MNRSLTLPSTLEEEANNKDLQASHGDHHETLDDRKVKDAAFRAAHRAEVAVLARPKVFLIPVDRRELA